MEKRILSGITVMFMLLLMVFSTSNSATYGTFISETDIPLSNGTNSSESALEFVSKMGAGWNLGNSFCCCDGKNYGEKSVSYYETLWGNPITTKATIDAVKAKGFKTVRIPITYRNHIDTNNQIDEKWLSRIKEVVDYVLQNDMYCIINVHHENWLVADTDKQAIGQEKLEAVWKQISEYFSDYGTDLIFEGFNEVINSAGQWDSADSKSYAVVNNYNQTFVDAVRSTGANNTSRYLIVNTYAAKATRSVLDGFVLPQDSTKDHLIVSTHIYDGIDSAKTKLGNLHKYFVKHNIPVIIGEWGKKNSNENTEDSRKKYASDFLTIASGYGITCIWWDDGGIFSSSSAVSNYAILQRKTGKWYFDKLATEIVNDSKIIYLEDKGYELVEDMFEMSDFSAWKTGDYSYLTGKYVSNANRLCLAGEKKLLANVTYTASINNTNYHILVRIINSSGKLVKTYNLANMNTFTVDSNDYTARVSIYNYSNINVCNSYEEYELLFKDGFKAKIEAELPVN
ncbi:MAG: glycoside hydrolase family 5 protein [Agathobacter sp.]|nr:glycoside hydrolase family 5 protein [Agathobacter sp.]